MATGDTRGGPAAWNMLPKCISLGGGCVFSLPSGAVNLYPTHLLIFIYNCARGKHYKMMVPYNTQNGVAAGDMDWRPR